jgi:hypothetical protein
MTSRQAGAPAGALPEAREFRVRAEALDAEDPIADLELGDGRTDGLDLAGKLQAEDPSLRAEETGVETPEKGPGSADVAIRLADRRRPHSHEDLVVTGRRRLDLLDSQDFGWPVPDVDDSSHRPVPFMVRTTFPVFCPVSTYFVASITSSSR